VAGFVVKLSHVVVLVPEKATWFAEFCPKLDAGPQLRSLRGGVRGARAAGAGGGGARPAILCVP